MNIETECRRALAQHDREGVLLHEAQIETQRELDACADDPSRHHYIQKHREALARVSRAVEEHAAKRVPLAAAVVAEEQRQRAAEEEEQRRADEEQRRVDEERAAAELAARLAGPLAELEAAEERLTATEETIVALRAKVKLSDEKGRADLVTALGLADVAAGQLDGAAVAVGQIQPNRAAMLARRRAEAARVHGVVADLAGPVAQILASIVLLKDGLTGVQRVTEERKNHAVPTLALALVRLDASDKDTLKGTLTATPLGVPLDAWLGVGATEVGAYEMIARAMGPTATSGTSLENVGRAVLDGRDPHALMAAASRAAELAKLRTDVTSAPRSSLAAARAALLVVQHERKTGTWAIPKDECHGIIRASGEYIMQQVRRLAATQDHRLPFLVSVHPGAPATTKLPQGIRDTGHGFTDAVSPRQQVMSLILGELSADPELAALIPELVPVSDAARGAAADLDALENAAQ